MDALLFGVNKNEVEHVHIHVYTFKMLFSTLFRVAITFFSIT